MSLQEMLEAIPDNYEGFVQGALHLSNIFDVEDVLERYLIANPSATSSDVFLFLFDCCGLEPLPIVPDGKD